MLEEGSGEEEEGEGEGEEEEVEFAVSAEQDGELRVQQIKKVPCVCLWLCVAVCEPPCFGTGKWRAVSRGRLRINEATFIV